MKKLQSQHVPKDDVLGPIAMLPIFIFAAFIGIFKHNYSLAVSSIVVWLLIFLFSTNYWAQAIVCLIGSLIALYYDVAWLTLILWLLFLYFIHATDSGKHKEADFPNTSKLEDSDVVIDLMMHRSPKTSIRIGSTVILILLSLLVVIPYLISKVWAFILSAISKF